MEYKSNITIASNIFARKHDEVKQDPDFVHHCRGGVALTELDRRLFGSNGRVGLTSAQDYERREDRGCSLARDDRQMTHGPVRKNGSVTWECRCEYESCDRFAKCMPSPIVRDYRDVIIEENALSAALQYEWLGTVAEIEQIFDEQSVDLEEEPIPAEFITSPIIIAGEYVKLTDPSPIITANIDSHILVNAGPGTGKTYTVIERLAHIIHSGAVDLGQVLVLCYTSAARDVILQRLAAKGLGEEARQLVICTLDSLAWQNLTSKLDDESQAGELFVLGYNGCIKKFNAVFDNDEWSQFEYVIVDELQDLVNERATMLLKMLAALRCGYLLLGDKCQAIYDYDCNDGESMNSVAFYKRLGDILPDDSLKYELTNNHRQSAGLSCQSNDYRDALLEFSDSEANEFFRDQISTLPSNFFSSDIFEELPDTDTTAILTRNNGEAEWVSAQLHKKCISHNLLRSVTPQISLHRWLADMFWDYREQRMSKDAFIERYLVRVFNDEKSAETAYDAVITSLFREQNDSDYFSLKDLTNALKYGQYLSPLFKNMPCESLTVSTIHKAKGREFDHVYLLGGFNPTPNNTEEARVWYVGATRPREELDCLQKGKWYVRNSSTNRWIWQGVARWGKSKFCDKIVIGLLDDIAQSNFIAGDLGEAVQRQAYIAQQVHINDKVEIYLIDGVYQIYHNNRCIGALTDDARLSLLTSIKSIYSWSDIPSHLSDIYVNNIVTIAPCNFPGGADAMFKDSGFWLGVELTGFAKADWHWEGM